MSPERAKEFEVKVYVSLDLRVSIWPTFVTSQTLWIDFPGEAEPRLFYLLTPEVYVRIEAKLNLLAGKVVAGEVSQESYAVASGRFLALQQAIEAKGGKWAIDETREAWRGKIEAGMLPPLPEKPPLVNFPNFNDNSHEHYQEWLRKLLLDGR